MATVHEFQVAMSCGGCSGAVTKALNKLAPDVSNVEANLDTQRVFVTSTLTSEKLLETIKKTGKACSYIGVKA